MSDNPFESPQTTWDEPPPALDADDYEPAGRATRFFARVVDNIILTVALTPIGMFIGVAFMVNAQRWQMQAFDWSAQVLIGVASFLVSIALHLLINGYLLAAHGQTVAKWMFGIKIVRRDGSPVSLGRIVGQRMLPMWVLWQLPLGALVWLINPLLIFRESRLCLHDDIADTKVVKRTR